MPNDNRLPGHHMQRFGHGCWCSCGAYLGGLGHEDSWLPSNKRQRFALHKTQVRNAQR